LIVSGGLARLHMSSGEIAMPRRDGREIACIWHYFPVPVFDPNHHILTFEPREATLVFESPPAGRRRRDARGLGLAVLTQREIDVVRLLLDGFSSEDIGHQLRVSVHTVRSHMQAIFRKIGVHSRPELLSRFISSPSRSRADLAPAEESGV